MLFEIEKMLNKETPNLFEIIFEVKKLLPDTLKISPKKLNYTLFKGEKTLRHKLKLSTIKGETNTLKITSYKPYLNNEF